MRKIYKCSNIKFCLEDENMTSGMLSPADLDSSFCISFIQIETPNLSVTRLFSNGLPSTICITFIVPFPISAIGVECFEEEPIVSVNYIKYKDKYYVVGEN